MFPDPNDATSVLCDSKTKFLNLEAQEDQSEQVLKICVFHTSEEDEGAADTDVSIVIEGTEAGVILSRNMPEQDPRPRHFDPPVFRDLFWLIRHLS